MSKIIFQNESGGIAEVRGSERQHFALMCNRIFSATLDIPTFSKFDTKKMDAFKSIFQETQWIDKMNGAAELHYKDCVLNKILYGDPKFNWQLDSFSLVLNTALRMGSDQVKLAARLHGQCEIHCFIKPDNMKWLKQIIQTGRNIFFFRAEVGWEELIQLLETSQEADEIVVSSYSVCEDFPNREIAGNPPHWEQFDREEQRILAIQSLLVNHPDRELNPKTWNNFYFESGWDALKINALINNEASI